MTAVSSSTLTPLAKRVLLTVSLHEPMTAREVALDVNLREATARLELRRLGNSGLVTETYNGRASLTRLTASGRATVEAMHAERVARAEHDALLAVADSAAIAMCPACRGERRYCTTCHGSRYVVKDQKETSP